MNELQKAVAASTIDPAARAEGDLLHRSYLFGTDFIGFAGHFPGYPVLPAVVQLLAVIHLVSCHRGEPVRLLSVEDARFLTPIRPGQQVDISCSLRAGGEGQGCRAEISVEGKRAATCSLLLAEVEP
jgi:3-hydroxyacyl-[acyl-carrier-protein] dehydratase